jgi:hypothetical protein
MKLYNRSVKTLFYRSNALPNHIQISKYTIPCPLMIGGARVGSFGTGYIFSAGVMLGAGVGCPG